MESVRRQEVSLVFLEHAVEVTIQGRYLFVDVRSRIINSHHDFLDVLLGDRVDRDGRAAHLLGRHGTTIDGAYHNYIRHD